MEDDEDEQRQPTTPFWLQNTAFRSSRNRSSSSHRLGTPSILFNSTSVILLLLVAAALIFIFFIIPSFLNFTSQIFRPNSVKRSWDSLNLVLILFAIICAFLGKTNNSENPHSSSGRFRSPSPSSRYNSDREQRHGQYSDRSYNSSGMTRLRSSSSYPDLRQQDLLNCTSPWVYDDDIDRSNRVANAYRFADDTQIRSNRFSESGSNISPRRRQPPSATEEPQDIVTETEDDKVVNNPKAVEASPPRLPSPPPSQPLPLFNPLPELQTRVKPKSRRTYRTIERDEQTGNGNQKPNPKPLPPPSPSRTAVKRKTKRVHRSFDDAIEVRDEDQQQKPPSPPQPLESDLSRKSDKKRSGATKDFLSSFSSNQKRKKKRERQRSTENFDHILNPLVSSPISATTPPPPPPPPPSVFHNLFSSKKGKRKKSAPEPPASIASKSRFTKPNTQIALAQPPIPTPTTNFTSYNISNQQRKVTRGNESPLYGIPEPPPLPPFGMPVWKFVVEGDYVRLKSMNSSRSGSTDTEEDRGDSIGASSGNGESMRSEMDEDSSSEPPFPAMFCPSPDVNTKADNFIARFRAGLKMEKVNSGKGVGLSRLGLNPSINDDE